MTDMQQIFVGINELCERNKMPKPEQLRDKLRRHSRNSYDRKLE